MPDIYKILRDNEWKTLQTSGFFAGSPVDQRDGFVHLSYAGQVRETATKHFSHAEGLVLLRFDSDDFGDRLKDEPSRGGALFPHLYGVLPLSALRQHWMLEQGDDGAPILPLLPLMPSLPEA